MTHSTPLTLATLTLLLATTLIFAETSKDSSTNNATPSTSSPPTDSGAAGGSATVGIHLNVNAPDFSAPDEQGRNTTLTQFTNKIIVLEWFDPLCDYTRRDYQARTPQTLYDRYKDKGVVWLSINSTRDSTQDHNRAWAEKNELKHPILDDSRKRLAALYGITTVPAYVIVDRHGTVVYTGALDEDESRNTRPRDGRINYIDRALAELTAGKPPTYPSSRLFGWPLH